MNHKESNVSDQKPEEDLREGERKYRDLADSLPQTVAEIDIAGNITFTNLASFKMFGYAKEDFDRGLSIFQMIVPEEHQRATENIQKFMIGQGRDGEQYIGVRKDGSRFPFTVYLTPVLRENKTVGFRIILIDITDRKRSEEALRTSQMQLSDAMDLAHIVYWEFDPVAQTYIFNDAFYALYGTTAEQEGGYLVSREDYAKRFIHPDDIPLYYQFVKENTLKPDTELSADIEHRIIRRNGEVRHIMVRTRAVKDNSGRIVKRYGVNQDITERKRAGEEIQYLATHDSLTGLSNRSMFSQLLNHAVQMAQRYQRQFAVLFIDLDRFKIINDTLGHEAGDQLLQEMATRLKQPLRAVDVVARLGVRYIDRGGKRLKPGRHSSSQDPYQHY